MLELGLKVLLAYLLGSLNGSLVLGKLLGGADVRTVGSGNAGGTNALRARGVWFALGTVVIDIGKGCLAAGLLPALAFPGVVPDPLIRPEWLAFACAGAAVVGHCYPVWFGFAGGKGGATTLGVLIVLAPWLLLPAALTWLLVVTATGYVGLATMLAAAVLPLYVAVTRLPAEAGLFVFLLLLALFIVYTHRGNVSRMLRHEENRMAGLMILRRPR
jgi:glycerol-3-phosphate acyltransferase PlsY